jgi:hypothetical protein
MINVVANDSDPEGNLDPASTNTACATCGETLNGSLVNNADGTFDYTPDTDFHGSDSFVYEICDTSPVCATASVSITVDPVADPPLALDDSANTPEDTPVTINVVANDSDPEGALNPASTNTVCATCSNPVNGGLVNNGDGTFDYTPNPDFNGTDGFVYEICDAGSLCATASVSITVDPVADPPQALDDSATTPEDTPTSIDVAANDSDPDGDLDLVSTNTTCAVCSNPLNGSLVNNADGTFEYTPDPNYNGSDSFVYEICDSDPVCVTASVSITVDPVADPPLAVNDSATTPEDTLVIIDVAANDSDPDGDLDPTSTNTTCPGCAGPTNGILLNNGDGSFTYTPDPDFNGSDSFVYEICDTGLLCSTASVSITVDPVADPPQALDDSATTSEDTLISIDVAANDSDPDGDLVLASANTTCATCAGPTDGNLVSNGDGTFDYSPDQDFNGSDSFVYEICDTGPVCVTASVNITVDPVADPPQAVDDSATTPEDTLVSINVAANDSDPDGDLNPASTNTTCAGCSNPASGSLVNYSDGTFDYTPNPDFNGSDGFVYEICDTGPLCTTASVSITVEPVADPPQALADSATTPEDTLISIDVAANDSDPDGDLNPTSTNTSCVGCSNPVNGGLVNNGDGTFDYNPDQDFNGSDSFVYEICDTGPVCATASVSITVDPVADPPLAVDDSASTSEDTPVIINVADNDMDPDGDLDPASINTSCATCAGPNDGSLVNNGDGTFDYSPDPDFYGSDSFVYEICDTGPLCTTASVSITVNPVADPPQAVDDSATTLEDTPVSIDVAANDSDPDGDLDPATANSSCANGSTGCLGAANGSLVDNGDGTITYSPDPDFNGSDSFVYEICDTGLLCTTASVSITVNPPASPEVLVDAVSSGTTTTSSIRISHTTSGANRLMLVGVSINNDTNETVFSVTYNNETLSYVNSVMQSDDARVEMWMLINPPIGTYDVIVTFNKDLKRHAIAGVITFTGVDQINPLGIFAGNNDTSNSASVTVESAPDELVLGVFACETCTSVTFSPPGVERWNLSAGKGGTLEIGAAVTYESTSSQVTVSASLGSKDHWALGAVSIRPAP